MHEFYSKYMFLSKEFHLLEVKNPVFYNKEIRYNSHLSRWIIVDADIIKFRRNSKCNYCVNVRVYINTHAHMRLSYVGWQLKWQRNRLICLSRLPVTRVSFSIT